MKRKLIVFFTFLIIITISAYVVLKYIFYTKKYSLIVNYASSIYKVDPNLIYAVIKQESKFKKDAISAANAKGLMQIMDNTAKQMAKGIDGIDRNNIDLFDPYVNIMIGTKYISYLTNHFKGNFYLAIAAYNAGLGKVDNWLNNDDYLKYDTLEKVLDIIEYEETKKYVKNVINNYSIYSKVF